MYKIDLALNNLKGLICRKIKPNQTSSSEGHAAPVFVSRKLLKLLA